MIPNLQSQTEACFQTYAAHFLSTLGLTTKDGYWRDGIIGGDLVVSTLGDISMIDIKQAVDNDMTSEDFLAWRKYNHESSQVQLFPLSLHEWNTPSIIRASQADIDLLLQYKEHIAQASHDEGTDSPNYTNACRNFDIARERILNSLHIYESRI